MEYIPPFEDYMIKLTEGQLSAVHAYYSADEESKGAILYHLQAWDRHYNRPCTLATYRRKQAAQTAWEPWVYSDGAGI